MMTFKQRLRVKRAAEKVLGVKSRDKFETKPTNISEKVRSVEAVIKYLIDNSDKIENLAVVTLENGDVESRWSSMKQSDVLYLSKVLSIEVEDVMRGDD